MYDKTVDVALSLLGGGEGAHCHTDVIYLLPLTGNKEGSKERMTLCVRPTVTLLPTSILYTPVDSTHLASKLGV